MPPIIHGHARWRNKSKEYNTYQLMLRRCNDPKNKAYRRYGARGIKVEYASFAEFLNDVGACPSPAHSIDRINNDDNYRSGNCRWATRIEQANNCSINRMLEYNGQVKTMAEWARECGIDYKSLHYRLQVGWSIEKALTTPERRRIIEYNGEALNVSEWARRLGIKKTTLTWHLNKGRTLAEIIKKGYPHDNG